MFIVAVVPETAKMRGERAPASITLQENMVRKADNLIQSQSSKPITLTTRAGEGHSSFFDNGKLLNLIRLTRVQLSRDARGADTL